MQGLSAHFAKPTIRHRHLWPRRGSSEGEPPRLSVTKSGCPAKPSICERRAASARPEEIVGPPVTAARRAAGDRRSMRKVRNPKYFAPARSNPFEDTNRIRPAAAQAA